MCDTIVSLPHADLNASRVLLKNSDREPDEAPVVEYVPRQHVDSDGKAQCTFISIPAVAETNACWISRPFQMWGAEMGVNEHGLAIGNEAVFTNIGIMRTNTGLTGMDLLRLALERCADAPAAIKLMSELLETYGQDACGGYRNKRFYYHNSFIVADPREAWILETAGRNWAAKRVDQSASISNALTIDTPTLTLTNVVPAPMSFAARYSDWLYTRLGRARKRQQCTLQSVSKFTDGLALADAFSTLRQHQIPDPSFRPSLANTGSVCMHATGLLNPSSTTGSMVAVIRSNRQSTVWMTGTAHPCLSIYIPFFFGEQEAISQLKAGGTPDSSLWWLGNTIHAWISRDYQRRRKLLRDILDPLQAKFIAEERRLSQAHIPVRERTDFSRSAVEEVYQALSIFREQHLPALKHGLK